MIRILLFLVFCNLWTTYASTTSNYTGTNTTIKEIETLDNASKTDLENSSNQLPYPEDQEDKEEQTTPDSPITAPEKTDPDAPQDPLSIEIIAGIVGGVVLICIVLMVIFIIILRYSCNKDPKPLQDPDNFESFRLMRSSANLLAISEPPRAIEGRARARAGSLQLSHAPNDAAIHDFHHSVKEACKQINGLEKQLGCLPEYLELVEGPDGVYLELTVEYDIKPEVEEYIPYAERFQQHLDEKNKKNRKA